MEKPPVSKPGGTSYNGLSRLFFTLQIYERVGISLVEVYEKVRKYDILVCKRPKMADRCIVCL